MIRVEPSLATSKVRESKGYTTRRSVPLRFTTLSIILGNVIIRPLTTSMGNARVKLDVLQDQ